MFVTLVYLGSHVFVKCCITSVGEAAAACSLDYKKSADLLDLLTVFKLLLNFEECIKISLFRKPECEMLEEKMKRPKE